MHVLNVEGELALADDLVVDLVPSREGREFWTGEFGEGVKVEAVGVEADEVEEPQGDGKDREGDGWSV